MIEDKLTPKPDTPWRRGRKRALSQTDVERHTPAARRIGRRRTIVPAPAGIKH